MAGAGENLVQFTERDARRIAYWIRRLEAGPQGELGLDAQDGAGTAPTVNYVQVTSLTQVSGRYPGAWYTFDSSDETFDVGADAVWVVPPNGEALLVGPFYLARLEDYANGRAVYTTIGPTAADFLIRGTLDFVYHVDSLTLATATVAGVTYYGGYYVIDDHANGWTAVENVYYYPAEVGDAALLEVNSRYLARWYGQIAGSPGRRVFRLQKIFAPPGSSGTARSLAVVTTACPATLLASNTNGVVTGISSAAVEVGVCHFNLDKAANVTVRAYVSLDWTSAADGDTFQILLTIDGGTEGELPLVSKAVGGAAYTIISWEWLSTFLGPPGLPPGPHTASIQMAGLSPAGTLATVCSKTVVEAEPVLTVTRRTGEFFTSDVYTDPACENNPTDCCPPPAKTTGLTVTPGSPMSAILDLAWDLMATATGYTVYKNSEVLAYTNASTHAYSDSGNMSGDTVSYAIVAWSDNGAGIPSSTVIGTAP